MTLPGQDRTPAITVSRAELLRFLRSHRYAVEATVTPLGAPQAAVVGIAVSDGFELVFDTVASSRKACNLTHDPRVALVIGGLAEGEGQTVQYEGHATLPAGAELERAQTLYFETFPDGPDRLAWPGLIHVRVRPLWLRYSDYRVDPPLLLEFDATELEGLL